MKQFKIRDKEVLFIEVPEDASDLTLPKVGMVDLYFDKKKKLGIPEEDYISVAIPSGFNFLSLKSQMTEGLAMEVMPKDKANQLYLIYNSDTILDTWVDNNGDLGSITRTNYGLALESFQSFCEANQLNDEYVILVKI